MTLNSKKNHLETVNEVVFNGVMKVVNKAGWTGTMTKLTTALNKVLSKGQKVLLPRSPGALRVVLNRIVNRLRNRKVSVKFARTPDHARTRYVKFSR